MFQSKFTRMVAAVLSLVMLFGMMPAVAFADETAYPNPLTVASTKTSALAPGVQEQEVVAYDSNGDRIVYFVVNANIATRSDVLVKANYHDNDNTGVWGKATVVEQANAATEKRGYNVVATTNAAYYNVSTGQPTGAFVMEGVNINGNGQGDAHNFFAIMKDGTAMIGKKGTWSQYADQVQEAVGGWTLLLWEGEVQNVDANSKYPRSTVGIKANGDVVLMLADGNQKPFSAGLTLREQGELMKSLGCEYAVELDGGGSATYAAKLEGTDEVVVRSTPCDGTTRSVSNSIMVISTAVADGTFDHANLSTAYAFYAPNSEVQIEALGADAAGKPADVPTDVSWQLSDDSFGYVENGIFYANDTLGTVSVQMVSGDKIVGSVDVTLVNPDEIAFGAEEKTVPYGRTSDFTVTAMYNGAALYAAADAFDFVCSAGSMDGFIYTAPVDETIASATVTATYKYAELEPTVVTAKFGKGSEILFDFEDADISEWVEYYGMVEAANNGTYTGGYTVVRETDGKDTASNEIDKGIRENVFLASKADGAPVYSGDYSLGYTLDYTQAASHANWMYSYLYYLGDVLTYRDVEKGINGTRLGMWMYIPEEAVGLCARLAYTYKDNTTGNLNVAYLYFTYQYVEKGFSKLTSEKIPEAGWAYVYCDMDQISASYVTSADYKDDNGNLIRAAYTNYAPAFIQFIVSSSATGAEKCTVYIDDITLDYSDVVDDRDAPIVKNPLILDDQANYSINGSTINFNKISVTADVAEDTSRGTNFTGLNTETAQIYVDGQEVATSYSAGKISANGIVLANGTHDITFEIADNQGNYTRLTRQVVIASEAAYPVVSLTGRAPATNKDGNLYTGSQYDLILKTDRVEAIDEITTKIWLNSASKWALEHMSVLPGFEVTYVLDDLACTAEITVTRVGDVEATGAAELVVIPVYAWSWDGSTGYDAHTQWVSENCAPQVDVSYKVKYGYVAYTAGNEIAENGYVPGFSNIRQDVDTELNSSIANLKNTIGEWHYHTEVTMDDVAATCTSAGYHGRTQCSECQSILNWGTVEEALGHNYQVVDGILFCQNCGEKMNGILNGKEYVDGVVLDGWIDDTYYYVDGVKVTEPIVIDKQVYVFGEDGVYQPDGLFSGFINTEAGKMFFLSKTEYVTGYMYFSNTAYYFSENGIARNGEYVIGGETCLFEDGVYVSCSTADLYMAGWAGENVHFLFYKDGRFVFSGEGGMFYHQSNASIPWAKERANIKSIFVGKDVTEIARFAFAHAYYVDEVVFEEGSRLEKIGYSAFHYLNRIESLVLPETVHTLEWRAFGYWQSLETIYLPDNIKNIHKGAFDGTRDYLVLQVAKGTYAEQFANTYGYQTELREKQPVVLGEGSFGEGLYWQFLDTGLLTLSGEGTMGEFHYAKYNDNAAPWSLYRSSIKKIVIGAGVRNIGSYAFYQCTALETVEFASGSTLKTIGQGAFGYCGLEAITLPASVESIGHTAFYFSSSLKSVSFEEGSKLQLIDDYAFRNCPVIETIYVPDGVTKMGSVILHKANAAAKLQVAEGSYAETYAKKNGYAVEVREKAPVVIHDGTFGDGLKWELYDTGLLVLSGEGTMGEFHYAKYNDNAAPWSLYRSDIKKIVIGAGVQNIGSYAFYQCTALETVEFAAGATLKSIGQGAFGYCTMETITLPASVESIGHTTFYFSNLKTVSFEEGSKLKLVGDYAFRNCYSIETIYIPDGVTKMGSVILHKANAAAKLQVAEGSYAETYAKKNGYAVEVREKAPVVIHDGTFGDGLKWELYDTGLLVLSGEGTMGEFHYAKYNDNAAPWSLYRSDIKKIVIGAGVQNIGSYAFYQCTALETVEFAAGATLKSIGQGAFGYCTMETITLPASLKTIGHTAFYFSNLKTVAFEEGSQLQKIDSYAFRDCYSLESIYVPAAVRSIGSIILHKANAAAKLLVVEGSYAHNYAVKNGYAFELC